MRRFYEKLLWKSCNNLGIIRLIIVKGTFLSYPGLLFECRNQTYKLFGA